jgi:flagellar protein FlbD
MIQLTRINHKPVVINSDLIEHIESTPDTVVSLSTKQSFMVLESVEEVIQRVIEFRRKICAGSHVCPYEQGVTASGRTDEAGS